MNFIDKYISISKISRIKFRNDINGLRAIAVISVVLYHAKFELFKGGWIGVDIFFVISGFLISNIILSELNSESFSFRNFYLRRFRRIIPALLTTILVSLPFGYFFLTPKANEEFTDSIFASLFFYSNLHFNNLDFYVSEATKFMPFLHTWSLAIEEQFYILFPLLTYLIFKFNKKFFGIYILIITFLSLIINVLTQDISKFYLPQFRVWELLIGVIIMIFSFNFQLPHLEKIGIPLMLIPIYYFDDSWINDIEPKLIALTGTALILFSNSSKSLFSKIMNLKIFTVIGLSSYSIYLFHQPIFAFMRIYFTKIHWENISDNTLSSWEILFSLFLLFIISIINYYFVEKYFIKSENYKMIIFIFIILISLVSLLRSNPYKLDTNAKYYEYTVNLKDYTPHLNNTDCTKISLLKDVCSFNPDSKNKIILLGDSHVQTLGYYLSKNLSDVNIEIFSGRVCLFLFDYKYHNECPLSIDNEQIKNYIASQENTTFIYGGDIWDEGYENFDLEISIKSTFEKLLLNENKIIVIQQIPNFPFNPIDKVLTRSFQSSYVGIDYSYWKSEKSTNSQISIYNKLDLKNLYLVSPEFYICDSLVQDTCLFSYEDQLFYWDSNHLTVDGVSLYFDELKNIINSIK